MELLWIDVYFSITLLSSQQSCDFGWSLGTLPSEFKSISNPLTIFTVSLETQGTQQQVQNIATIGIVTRPIRYNFQDANGHGYLMATDTYNVYATRVTAEGRATIDFRMYYRFIDISLVEYIGIVQSTTQT